jgi:hypothetical protein
MTNTEEICAAAQARALWAALDTRPEASGGMHERPAVVGGSMSGVQRALENMVRGLKQCSCASAPARLTE